jgi:COP9 signalosome complex subunit 6
MAGDGAASTSGDAATRQVGLHPLAIVGVSDHFTRASLGGGRASPGAPVVGLLFGKQDGLAVTVCDAIEVALAADGTLDHDYVTKATELYTDVYADRELLGWYCVAAAAAPEHLALHEAFVRYNEAPLLLLMDPAPDAEAKDLPVTVLEHQVQVVDGAPTTLFATVPVALVTVQAERIAMEHVAKAGPAAGESALDCHVDAVDASLKTLSARVGVLARHLRAVDAGAEAPDHALLRSLRALCDTLPAGATGALAADFLRDYNEGLMIAYLAHVTKNANAAHDLSDKFALINARGSKLV